MAYHVTTRWGGDEPDVSLERMREVLAELNERDDEHTDVSLAHETEWSLGAFPNGLLVWENLEEGEPKHMNNVSLQEVLELWDLLSAGNMEAIHKLPWLPGYRDRV